MKFSRLFHWPECGFILAAIGWFVIFFLDAESPADVLDWVLTFLSQLVVVSVVSGCAFWVFLLLKQYFHPSISTIEEFQNELVKLGIAQERDFHGCTEDEIQLLMDDQKVEKLPALYRDLLRAMGKGGAGHFEHDTDFFYQDLFGKKDVLRDIAENQGWELPEDAFVFSVGANYEYLYFRTIEGDDPPVYLFYDGVNGKPGKTVQHLSQELSVYVQEYSHAIDQEPLNNLARGINILRKNYNDLDDLDEVYYWEGKPFTGIAYELYPNGQIESEAEMVDGVESGWVREWYPSGALKLEGYGKYGEGYAWSREWFENGNLKSKTFTEYGFCIRERFWDEEGQLISEYERPDS